MEELDLLIPQIELDNENWIVKIIVIEDIPTLTRTKSGAKYKRYVVVYREGNEVLVIAFLSAISPVSNTLNLFEVSRSQMQSFERRLKSMRLLLAIKSSEFCNQCGVRFCSGLCPLKILISVSFFGFVPC
ncbi:hypothetical protein LIER_16210 [Lithospermum erythrorhizon]|uniref:4Fe-4S ferredoxin-type domain-containing protein n=1 Tax=Lithospermum erythrorhizon TaxID=34254 RepID=A0AAV3Q9X9_LITER